MQDLMKIGKQIYNTDNPRELRRFVIFLLRCCVHKRKMEGFFSYFGKSPLLQDIAATDAYVYEQATRQFFYKDSTLDERIRLIEEHMDFFTDKLQAAVVRQLYAFQEIDLWQTDLDATQKLRLLLKFAPGQQKEGLLSVILDLDDINFYQILFWVTREKGVPTLWIGAMQGPNLEHARELVKCITKRCFGYRTKNLILYATRLVAKSLGIEKIYAVTNHGYYANNHVRVDRKLKTSFSDFWQEAGGHSTADARFDELPLVEPRKTMEEVPTRKRAVYRKRFAMLDGIDAAILSKMDSIVLPQMGSDSK